MDKKYREKLYVYMQIHLLLNGDRNDKKKKKI